MKNPFVPFRVPASDGVLPKSEAQTEIVTGAKAFLPFTQNVASTPSLHDAHGEPSITLERKGDCVTCITVRCPCGNILELACEY